MSNSISLGTPIYNTWKPALTVLTVLQLPAWVQPVPVSMAAFLKKCISTCVKGKFFSQSLNQSPCRPMCQNRWAYSQCNKYTPTVFKAIECARGCFNLSSKPILPFPSLKQQCELSCFRNATALPGICWQYFDLSHRIPDPLARYSKP